MPGQSTMPCELLKVVVVHADASTRTWLATLLESLDRVRVYAARNGGEAVQMALQVLPRLVLIDPYLQGMDGFATMVTLRAHGIRCPIVTLLEQHCQAQDFWQAQGFVGAIAIADGPAQLRARIKALLDDR